MNPFLKVKDFLANPALRSIGKKAAETVAVTGLGMAALTGLKTLVKVGRGIFAKKII